MNLQSKEEYKKREEEHPKYISNPKEYFKDCWISWYHYLGINTEHYPATKQEWVSLCKELGVVTWEEYKKKNNVLLPINPGEMYEDFTNWDIEFGVELEEELVW